LFADADWRHDLAAIAVEVRDAGFVSEIHAAYDDGYSGLTDMNAAGQIIAQGNWGG